MPERLHVVAAALVENDRVLINQRLAGSHMAGRWEFPGGKLEDGESPSLGLQRELDEELGIHPTKLRPLIRIIHEYPGRSVLLECWLVERWEGVVVPREGHPLQWVPIAELGQWDILEADRPIISALMLPDRYAITCPGSAEMVLAHVDHLLQAGHRLIQLRTPAIQAIAAEVVARCHAAGARVMLNSEPGLAKGAGADGVHLTASRLRKHQRRDIENLLVAASCHDADELRLARDLQCDFVVLGPVKTTPSHPGAAPMGWKKFSSLADCAGMPVFALGGLGDTDLEDAWMHHAQGVAGISTWQA